MRLDEGATVDQLVRGLQSIGATASAYDAILQAIKASGALQAELESLMIPTAPTATSITATSSPPAGLAPKLAGSASTAGKASPQSVKLSKAAGEFSPTLLESLSVVGERPFTMTVTKTRTPSQRVLTILACTVWRYPWAKPEGSGIKNMIIKSLEPKDEAPAPPIRST